MNEPQSFRKKPVVIQAMQLRQENWQAVVEWMNHHEVYPMIHSTDGGQVTKVAIDTLEGTMDAVPGDWIIRGIAGEFYPCKPDIFDDSYERAGR